MIRASLAAALVATAVLGGCVSSTKPPTTQVVSTVEDQKKQIAVMRDSGKITFEEAARRQFAVQRNNYALTDGELDFWRQSIAYARQVDRREIDRAEYFRLIQLAYQRYAAPAPRA